MRAASPPRQIERENEMIVISHRLFLWSEKQVGQLLFLFFFIGYFFQYDRSPLLFRFKSIFFRKMLRIKDNLHAHAIKHFIDGMLCLI